MKRNPYVSYLGASLGEVLEKSINRAAGSSAKIAQLLEPLEGKSIRFVLVDLNCEFVLNVANRTVFIDSDGNGEADLLIRTTVAKLLTLATARELNPTQLDGIDIVGDVKLVQHLYSIFQNIDFDWEEELSKRVGDIPARHLGNLLRWGGQRVGALRSTFSTRVRSTLVDEHHLVAERSQVDRFLDSVDTLQADIDRLDKRVQRLERRTDS